uniref:Uncharacterized protein n=1 Tax=viral metagenome TaxID=1070528 RepID=A0A6C0JJ66_9ZZZZ
MSQLDYKVELDKSNEINKQLESHNASLEKHNASLEKHNERLDALNKQHYNLYMETKLKFERLQDELLIFHAEVRGHKINWEDMFYSTPDVGCDYSNEYHNENEMTHNKKSVSKERKRSRSI